MIHDHCTRRWPWLAALLGLWALAGWTALPAHAQLDEELEELLAEERLEADRLRRRGRGSEARALLAEHLADGEDIKTPIDLPYIFS